jgi:hypothetical protein
LIRRMVAELKPVRRTVDTTDMEADTKVTRPPAWVFGVLFLAYLGTHVALLLFVYTFAPPTPYFLAEMVAIAGGAAAASASLLVWRRSTPAERRWASGSDGRA